MKMLISKFLEENTNYLIAIFVLAVEKDYELLEKVIGERGAFERVQQIKFYSEHIKIHCVEDFPIVITEDNRIVRNDFHVASCIVAGKNEFGYVVKKVPTETVDYGDNWLKETFTPAEAKRIQQRYKLLVRGDGNPSAAAPTL